MPLHLAGPLLTGLPHLVPLPACGPEDVGVAADHGPDDGVVSTGTDAASDGSAMVTGVREHRVWLGSLRERAIAWPDL